MLPPAGAPLSATPSYDEQLGVTFTQNFTSLGYDVTAVEQMDPATGTGPAYLLNGLSSGGYWYQVGLSWNWSPGSGFAMSYEVFDSSGNSIFPTNGGGGLLSLSGTVNQGDLVHLSLYFSGGNVIMAAHDASTGASASIGYTAGGSALFVGSPHGPANSNGFFTGLMTEAYHAAPYYGDMAHVVYSQANALTSGWMWMDEFEVSASTLVFSACANSCLSPVSWSNPTLFQYLSSNGATEASNAYEFVTGSLALPVIMAFSYSVQGGGSAYSPPVLTYTYGGTTLSAALSLSPTHYQLDQGSQWSVSAVLGGSNSSERWETSQQASGSAQSGQSISFLYYHQYSASFLSSVQGGGSGYTSPTVEYSSLGIKHSTQTGIALWLDAGSSYAYTNPLGGSNSSQRWFGGPLASGSIRSSGSISVVYYRQFPAVASYQVVGGGTYSPPILTGTYLGATRFAQLPTLSSGQQFTVWLDSGSSYQLSSLLPLSSRTERWYGEGTSGTIGGPVNFSATYFHQFQVAVSYEVTGGRAPSAPTITFWSLGTHANYVASLTPTLMWIDDNSWTATPTLAGSGASERWAIAYSNGTVDSSNQLALQYFHQFSMGISYSVSDGSQPVPPTFSTACFGSPSRAVLGLAAASVWVDSGAAWSVGPLLNGSGTSERWTNNSAVTGSATAPLTVAFSYLHQFRMEFTSAQPVGGILPTSGWYNATSFLRLQAQANPGWQFENWSGNGTGSYTGTSNSENVTILSPITEKATFYPGLTVLVSGSGGVESSWAGGNSASAARSETIFVPVGTNVSLRASPSSFLFSFDRFDGAVNSSKAVTSVMVGKPLSVTGRFSPNYLSIGGTATLAGLGVAGAVYLLRRRTPARVNGL